MTLIEVGSRRWPGDHPVMDLEQIFLGKLADLGRRVEKPDLSTRNAEYELLMAAPLLREILFGSPVLIHVANREHRLKVRFRFVSHKPLPPDLAHLAPMVVTTLGNMPTEAYPEHLLEDMTLDQFLGAPVAYVLGRAVTVRDVVDYAANVAGGVHLGESTSGNRPTVRAIDEMIRMNGWSALYVFLVRIGRATEAGLQALAEKVRQDYERPA